jgi:hypothetical protein
LQLPAHLPPGRAIVSVQVVEPLADDESAGDPDFDRNDIEWWDEFGDGAEETDEASAPAHDVSS